jgi:UDP-3-O-[3-hydroxymyristoyl] glucosamine N-acyltransferase
MTEKNDPKRPSFKLKDLARMLDCPFTGDGETILTGVAALDKAGPGDLAFWADPKLREALERTRAGAVVIPPGEPFDRRPALRSETPHLTFVRAVELFFSPYRPAPGVHPTAVVAPSARLGRDVSVGALTVIGEEAEVGDGAVLFPLVSIYPRVKIGAGSIIHSHVSLREDVRVGQRVVIHGGVVIGTDGFAYLQGPDGTHRKIPQKGTVVIEDDVEIGANTTIDRAALGETIVRRGTKIDNLVMVAHNVEVGTDSLLIAQVGIAGSSTVGNNVLLAGQVGIADHVHIGDRVVIAAKSGITKDVPSGAFVAGSPHLDIHDWRKFWVSAPHLYDLVKELKRLTARVEELEKKAGGKGPGPGGTP